MHLPYTGNDQHVITGFHNPYDTIIANAEHSCVNSLFIYFCLILDVDARSINHHFRCRCAKIGDGLRFGFCTHGIRQTHAVIAPGDAALVDDFGHLAQTLEWRLSLALCVTPRRQCRSRSSCDRRKYTPSTCFATSADRGVPTRSRCGPGTHPVASHRWVLHDRTSPAQHHALHASYWSLHLLLCRSRQ